jgi:AraC-like DNA-binding protein
MQSVPGKAGSGRVAVHAMDALIGSEGSQLTELFDFMDDVIAWVKDRQGRYQWVNRAFLTNYAVNKEAHVADTTQVLGKSDYDLCSAYLADQYRSDDEQVLAGNRILNRVELVGQSDGMATWNVTNKIPLRGQDGSVVGTAGTTRRLREQDAEVVMGPHFGPVLNHLRTHYRLQITNRQLARLSGLSVRAFERKFLACFQVTPQKYLRKLRLRMASRALVYGRQSIVEVALSCGFGDQSHFTREFHRHFGRTPRKYREWYARLDAALITKSAVHKQ